MAREHAEIPEQLEEVLTWVRAQPGTQRLRALLVFDEVYGFLPPHPQNPPTKRPLVALMKQARAFGVGTPGGEVGVKPAALATLVKKLAPHWFLVRDVAASSAPTLLYPRWAITHMRGPMTREELARARG